MLFSKRLKISEARTSKASEIEKNRPVGTIIDNQGHVACGGNTILQILKIQPAGKQSMDFQSAVNGGYIQIGDILE